MLFLQVRNIVRPLLQGVLKISSRSSSDSSRLYTKKHEWISMVGNNVGRVGISNHAQEALGDVVYVQLPEVGAKFNQFDEAGAIESVKAASELLTPVSGDIVKVNDKLEDKPSLINSDCYGDGWLFDIKVDESDQLDKLMNQDQYEKYLREDTEN